MELQSKNIDLIMSQQSMFGKKLNEKNRHKEYERKKNKKKRKRNESKSNCHSSNSTEEVWVEKTPEKSNSTSESQISSSNVEQNVLKRDEWMNLDSIFPYTSQADIKKVKLDIQKKSNNSSVLDAPGQSDKELNPYWKNGGCGLPQSNAESLNVKHIIDAAWLKKSLKRAQELALVEGRTLREIAAERWGSLETIQSMIREAEDKAVIEKNTSQKYRKYDYVNNFRVHKNEKLGLKYEHDSKNCTRSMNRKHALYEVVSKDTGSKSHSTSNDQFKKYYNKHNELSHDRQKKQSYKKPNDDDIFIQNTNKLHSTYSQNLQVEKTKKNIQTQSLGKSLTSNECIERKNNEVEDNIGNQEIQELNEMEMNKLGARIIKAEIMGDTELAAQLKRQLDKVKQFHAKMVPATKEDRTEESVILMRINSKGISTPMYCKTDRKQFTQNSKRKKHVETHASGERFRYYADDDKYSLQEIYQHEKQRLGSEEDALFVKSASKTMDMAEIFEQTISQAESSKKQEKYERILAIKEHTRMAKSLDNCYWCFDSKHMLKHMIITVNSKICLSLPVHASVNKTHCLLTPIEHVTCQLQLDEDVWEQLNMVKTALITMFTDQKNFPIFFEVYKNRHKFPHMQLGCIAVPMEVSHLVPIYFKKALLECETEWSVNKKIIDLHNKDLRQAIPSGLSYFAVQFGKHNGYAHIIEDERTFSKSFAEEIISGILQLDYNAWHRSKRDSFEEQIKKVKEFTEEWKKYNIEI